MAFGSYGKGIAAMSTLRWPIVALTLSLSHFVSALHAQPFTPPPDACTKIAQLQTDLRQKRQTRPEDRRNLGRFQDLLEDYRLYCLGAHNLETTSPGKQDEKLVEAAKQIPSYKTAAFECSSDFEMCKNYYLAQHSPIDANFSCGIMFLVCLTPKLVK
jgi:hypothetical protein